jgi:DNA-binding MarR family transcriptional regulator
MPFGSARLRVLPLRIETKRKDQHATDQAGREDKPRHGGRPHKQGAGERRQGQRNPPARRTWNLLTRAQVANLPMMSARRKTTPAPAIVRFDPKRLCDCPNNRSLAECVMSGELELKVAPSDIVTEPVGLGDVGGLFTVRLRRTEYLLSRAVAKAWGDRPLRTGTIGVLSQIAKDPGISQSELSRRTTFDKSAINAIINGLEQLGWANRRKAEDDRRRHELYATDAGMAALQGIVARIRQIEVRMLANVAPHVLEQLCDMLDQVHLSCLAADSD